MSSTSLLQDKEPRSILTYPWNCSIAINLKFHFPMCVFLFVCFCQFGVTNFYFDIPLNMWQSQWEQCIQYTFVYIPPPLNSKQQTPQALRNYTCHYHTNRLHCHEITWGLQEGLVKGGNILTRHNNVNLSIIYQLRAVQEHAITDTFLAQTLGYLQFIQQHTV